MEPEALRNTAGMASQRQAKSLQLLDLSDGMLSSRHIIYGVLWIEKLSFLFYSGVKILTKE